MYTLYTKTNCSYCVKAKQLLAGKQLEYLEKNIELEEYKIELLTLYPLAKTVPQIFLNGVHIGGHDELVEFFKQTI